MKIILKEDVDQLGTRGQVVAVKDGYARNYLIPQSLAMRYTEGVEKILNQEKRKYDSKQTKDREEAETLAAVISALDFTVAKRVGDQDTLYGSVTQTDLVEMLEAKGVTVEKKRVALEAPIKKLGDFEIPVKLHKDVPAAFQLHVVKEE
jgi:large subunit ribosomal protein L9